MKWIESILSESTAAALQSLFNTSIDVDKISFQKTNPEFEGDITLVVFPFVKVSKRSPEETGKAIGEFLVSNCTEVGSFNVVKGFLNLVIRDAYWINSFSAFSSQNAFGIVHSEPSFPLVMIEYSSPNTNKPLHLGHIRNNLLGFAVANILEATGKRVTKVNLVNDRGIHICKSMLAWKKWGNGETPESSGLKGDHFVGKYYVEYDRRFKEEVAKLVNAGMSKEDAEKSAPVHKEIQEMLLKWEAGDKEVRSLWKMMNDWVYEGFAETYKDLGVSFDKIYYESETYLLGKKAVEEGLKKEVFFKKPDGSVWVDLTADGLDQKVLLRADGTSVYMTQDIGTAMLRYSEFPDVSSMIYTVGNEQEYHFKVLFLILGKLGCEWAKNCYHLSYGMVELPDGKMKSREGTVVDADDLIAEMIQTAKEKTEELGKIDGLSEEDAGVLYRTLAMGALKYFLLKVDPKKKMVFNPKESIDFNGHTGPFIQYTHARIRSVLRKAGEVSLVSLGMTGEVRGVVEIKPLEKALLKRIHDFPAIVREAGGEYNPAVIANYVYHLAKDYNHFYHEVNILKEPDERLRNFRLSLSKMVSDLIHQSMTMLGISVPERM